MRLKLLTLLVIIFTAIACKGPEKAFQKGNYQTAFRQSLKKLKRGKADNAEKSILIRSLNELNKADIDKIIPLEESSYIENWESAFSIYEELLDRNETVREYLPDESGFEMEFHTRKRDALGEALANEYKLYGLENLKKADSARGKKYARIAYADFEKALEYGGEENALQNLQEQAISLGRVHYSIELDTRFHQYEWELNRAFDWLSRESSTFRNINVEAVHAATDCVMLIEFSDVEFLFEESTEQRDYSQEVISGYETRVDTAGVASEEPIYETVTATVETLITRKTARMAVRILAENRTGNCDYNDRNFSAAVSDDVENTIISGDRRAVPGSAVGTNDELAADDDMADDLIEALFDDVKRSFY